MQHAVKKTTAFVATAAAVGFSSLFLLAAPASAAPVSCGNGATLLVDNICELTVTTVGETEFTPTADMTQLEALLVGGGGSGSAENDFGYGAGGGGEVRVVGFADSETIMYLEVGGSSTGTAVTQGGVTELANYGGRGTDAVSPTSGGESGNGNPGAVGFRGAGGGAGAAATDQYNGGAGVTPASIAPAGSLFSADSTCYGGGGASATDLGTIGVAGCGGGYATQGETGLSGVAATPNTGGGGGAVGTTVTAGDISGASGVIVLRWVALGDVTVTFDTAGLGAGVAPQTFAVGGTATRPADPTATGYTFNGWFADTAFTAPVDFSAPVNASATYYASFTPVVVPATVTVTFNTGASGAGVAPQTVPAGSTVARPADPVVEGYTFNGWFSDAAFTTPVDFSAPVTASSTFYASFTAIAAAPVVPTPTPTATVTATPAQTDGALASTGGTIDTSAIAAGLGALLLGGSLLVATRLTRRTRNAK